MNSAVEGDQSVIGGIWYREKGKIKGRREDQMSGQWTGEKLAEENKHGKAVQLKMWCDDNYNERTGRHSKKMRGWW